MRILIVEDDMVIAQGLKALVDQWQYEGLYLTDFTHIDQEVKVYEPHLILMDVNLPYYNGYYWCQQIRQFSNVPIIFISSLTDRMDIVMAIQMGADDYLAKPIDKQLTITKIQALLRRTYQFAKTSLQTKPTCLIFGEVVLDLSKASLHYQAHDLHLTMTELQILTILIQAQGAFVKRSDILDYCWQNDQFIDDNTLAVNISRLRKKLATIDLADWIITKKQVGYALQQKGDTHA